ncbi:hypothetical protein FQR65_LT18042 [Abscondita terminalis]|nr:hypothetical protein FQR65_LT18042 [Abscondita terminalis]
MPSTCIRSATLPLSKREPLLPPMFDENPEDDSPFQLNGRLLSNEMQLQLPATPYRVSFNAMLSMSPLVSELAVKAVVLAAIAHPLVHQFLECPMANRPGERLRATCRRKTCGVCSADRAGPRFARIQGRSREEKGLRACGEVVGYLEIDAKGAGSGRMILPGALPSQEDAWPSLVWPTSLSVDDHSITLKLCANVPKNLSVANGSIQGLEGRRGSKRPWQPSCLDATLQNEIGERFQGPTLSATCLFPDDDLARRRPVILECRQGVGSLSTREERTFHEYSLSRRYQQ